jgi:raffinose/stachyose/melibiose transport system substrate-binding protein
VAQERGWVDNYGQALLDFANAGTPGHVYGVPTGAATVGVYYNPDIFAQYGLEVPTTFEEFETILATLRENGVTPIAVGALDQWPLGHVWEQLIHSNADFDLLSRLYTLDPEASYEDPSILAATAKLQEWAELGYFQDNFLATNFADANNLFITGQAAMNIGGTWVATDFTVQPEFEAHFFPLPQMNPDLPWHTGGQAPDNNWVVSTYSAHQAAAIDFVDYILSEAVALEDWNQGNIVNYRFTDVPEPTTVLQGDIYRAMQMTGPGYYMAVTGELLASQGAIVQQVAASELTPEEAMAEMQAVYLQGATAN